jgi:hypothetical protein
MTNEETKFMLTYMWSEILNVYILSFIIILLLGIANKLVISVAPKV